MMQARDTANARQVEMLAALLDHEVPPWRPGELPPLAHWLLFPPIALQSQLGHDGHPLHAEGGDLPRRMWAGGRVRFLAPIPVGAALDRQTEEIEVQDKVGRSGKMRFVTLRHSIYLDGMLVIEEEQDLVYRQAAAAGVAARPPLPSEITPLPPGARTMQADPIQLFRFSAMTFNSHRIHYDRDYAAREEGYPALVVHGPFIATLLMDHYLRAHPGSPVARFAFRAARPIFDTDPFSLASVETDDGAELMAIDVAGGVAMTAQLTRADR